MLCLNGVFHQVVTCDRDGTLFVGVHTGDAFDNGGLTCAVVAQYANDLTGVANNVDILYSIVGSLVVLLVNVFYFK